MGALLLPVIWHKGQRTKNIVWEAVVNIIRRLVLSLAVLTFPGAAIAQSYPDHPVKIIVGFAPGGPTAVSYTHLTLPTIYSV